MNDARPAQLHFIGVALIVIAPVLQLFFFQPMQVFIRNFAEFSAPFAVVAGYLLALSAVLVLLFYLVVRRWRNRWLLSAMAFVSVAGFLESRLFLALAHHQPFDGTPIDWDALQWLGWTEAAALLAVAVVLARARSNLQLLSSVSFFIFLFLASGFAYQTIAHRDYLFPPEPVVSKDAAYFERFYRLSSKRNVIHIVPDQTQGAMLHEILLADDRYRQVFDGFTFFTQAMGHYKGTYPNVLYYMAGEAPEPGQDMVVQQKYTRNFVAERLRDRSIVTLLADSGFDTFGFQFHPGIFCYGEYTACTGTHEEIFAGLAINSPARRKAFSVLSLLDVALFQTTPVPLRKIVFDEGRWFFRNLAKGSATHSGVLDMFVAEMQVGEFPDSYNYFHHAGAHAPLLFDRDCRYTGARPITLENQREQVKCSLLQFEKLIEKLKELGVYDQTMIVIHGDHGTPGLPPNYPKRSGRVISDILMGKASTLLMVKPPGARGPLGFSDKPVTTGDIPATIADAFGLANQYTGLRMFSDEADAKREREYYSYESSAVVHDLQVLPNLTRYRVRGNVFDEGDWVLPDIGLSGEFPSGLNVGQANFEQYAKGFSFLEQQDVPRRWVDGKEAMVYLSPPSRGTLLLVFSCLVPSSIDGQWMEISIGGEVIARLDAEDLRADQHSVALPDDVPHTDVLEIGFTMGKTVSSEIDPRRLSVLFSFISLVPAS